MMKTPLVSISCITYNHESYIRECLDGFLMQETNFPFEVLIHDDASTDGTAEIIKEYEVQNPDIIKPIYQTENQWSKGVSILGNVTIGEKTFIGTAATILPKTTIGKNVFEAACLEMTKDMSDNCMAAGVPAVIKKMYKYNSN